MNISYNWLKDYINTNLQPEELAKILTTLGLETGSIEPFESIKGGLKGLVVGEVLTCVPHANSDHLSCTTVNVGAGEVLPIVCGAANVAAGQKVIVATVGTTLYDGDKEFVIKKSKIRGEESMGMICAEDEIGVGTSHDGIMVLTADSVVGTPAADFFNIQNDVTLEVDLTPNRIDAASHIGIARDLAAYLKQSQNIEYTRPSVEAFKVDNHNLPIGVEVLNAEACPRYCGVTLSGITVKDSPEWLQNRLKAIGQQPINNVVDVTNYVLHECGQPLHAFDAAEIKGNKVIVGTLPNQTAFTTLDKTERKLSQDDLMICNAEGGMCIAGVFGGLVSGVKEQTTDIFLESAYFNPVWVRKTARRHGLNTDASFRFERGIDPNGVVFALKRAALLIKEVAGGTISSDVIDIYSTPVADFEVFLRYRQVARLLGVEIPKEQIRRIVESLEMKVVEENAEGLKLMVPPYRVDVQREADVIEEILRIYGYNTVPIYSQVNSTLSYAPKPDPIALRNLVADFLTANGFNEMMANSLTKADYYETGQVFKKENLVNIVNPLSQDLNAMRQTLLFAALETVSFNSNRQNSRLKLYEFGNCYFYQDKETDNALKKYSEGEHLSILVTGDRAPESWMQPTQAISFYYLKQQVENILTKLGVNLEKIAQEGISNENFSEALSYTYNGKELVQLGSISKALRKKFDIKQDVYFAEIDWNQLFKSIQKHKVEFSELPKFPEVRRDLSLLLDKQVTFNQLKQSAMKVEKSLLRQVNLFDVYEGANLGENKKSYALSFILRDNDKTLNDKQIEKIMEKITQTYERDFAARLR